MRQGTGLHGWQSTNLPVCVHHAPTIPQGDILEDLPLITNLEETKATSTYVVEKVKQAKDTEVRFFDDQTCCILFLGLARSMLSMHSVCR